MSKATDPPALKEPSILSAYTADHNAPWRKRRRAAIVTAVLVFCFFFGAAFALFGTYLVTVFLGVLAILAAVVIWSLPDTRSAPSRLMEFAVFGILLSQILWPNYMAIAIPGLPWITMIRLSEAPLVLALLLSLSQSQPFRRKLGEILGSTPLIWKLLVGFVALQVLTIPLSKSPVASSQAVIELQIACTTVYFSSAYIFAKPRRAEWFIASIVVALICLSAISPAEFRHGQVLWADKIPGFLKVNDPIVRAILAGGMRAYTGVYRVQTIFSTSLGFGEFIALAAPFVIYFIIMDQRWPVRIMAAISAPLVVYAALLSGARSAVLGCLISAMLWLFVWAALNWKHNRHSLLAPTTVLAFPIIGSLTLAATLFVGRLHRAVWGGAETNPSTEARQDQWGKGIPMILTHPLGHGAGQGGETLGYRMENGVLSIDSYYLVLLLEYGIIGFVIYLLMIFAAIYYSANTILTAPRLERDQKMLVPLAISIIIFLIIKSVFAQEDIHPLVYMMLGIITAIVYRSRNQHSAPDDGEPTPPLTPSARAVYSRTNKGRRTAAV